MEQHENTLESIIQAARSMASRHMENTFHTSSEKAQKTENSSFSSIELEEETVEVKKDPGAETLPENEDSSGTDPSPGESSPSSEAESLPLIQTAGIHFLEFAVAFLTLAKCQYQHENDVKVNSLPFFTLIALDSWADSDYTMSDLADKLQITKQQLSRLINVLEEKGLVERIHDTANRRRVYIRICPSGRRMMNSVKQDMLNSTIYGLRSYSENELEDLDRCICRLIQLMEKFNTDPD